MSQLFRLRLGSRILLPVVLLGALCASAYAQTRAVPAARTTVAAITRVDVFVSDKTPIAAGTESQGLAAGGSLNLWNLDDMERFNSRLALGLPPDMATAQNKWPNGPRIYPPTNKRCSAKLRTVNRVRMHSASIACPPS